MSRQIIDFSEKAKIRRDYFKQYRLKHLERVKAQVKAGSRRHYLRNKEQMAQKYLEVKNTIEYKEQKNNQRQRYMDKWKSRAFHLLGDKCSRCGFTDKRALQIDHINSDGYLDRVKRNATHYKKVVNSVLSKERRFQILCCNCNWIKRFEEQEYIHAKERNGDRSCEQVKTTLTFFPLQDVSSKLD